MYNRSNIGEETRRKITVSGEGNVTVNPDMATATLGIRTESANLQEAQAKNAKMANELLGSMSNLGIPKEDIQTADYRIDPIYTYDDGTQKFQGYRVTHLFTITVRNTARIGKVIDTAVKNGANEIINIQFSVSNSKQYYEKALALAVSDSYQKARTVAATLGFTSQLQMLSVAEDTQRVTPGPMLVASFEGGGSSATPIEPGKLQIKASVTAMYTV